MSEEAEVVEVVEDIQEDAPEIEASPEELSYKDQQSKDVEDTARRTGWTSREEWTEQGKDPDEWISAKRYNENGKTIGKIIQLQRQQDAHEHKMKERLDNQRKYMEAQNKVTIDNLQKQKRDAIENADVAAAESIQGQIDVVKQDSIPTPEPKSDKFSPQEQALVDDFNAANTWIKQDSPKASWMIRRFNHYGGQGMSVQDAISSAKRDIDKEFPAVNPRRSEAPVAESSRSKPGKKAAEKTLTWGDLSPEEVKMYKSMGGKTAFKTQEKFLQTVKDSRASE